MLIGTALAALLFTAGTAAPPGSVPAARLFARVNFARVDAPGPRTRPRAGPGGNPASLRLDATGRDQSPPAAVAVAYSHGYRVRARVHKIASTAMLPLFAAQVWLGDSLYTDPTSGRRTAHIAVGSAIGGLFTVNTVTGVWNLVEARKDPVRRRQRLWHGMLMLAADGGFVTTALLAPRADGGGGSRGAHRAVAFTSIGVATAGYLVMLFGSR